MQKLSFFQGKLYGFWLFQILIFHDKKSYFIGPVMTRDSHVMMAPESRKKQKCLRDL